MTDIDWTQTGAALAAILAAVGTVAGGAWAWWQRNQKAAAQTRADVAEADRDRTVADAQNTVYTMLVERVKTLEAEVHAMRTENAAERSYNRELVLHVWTLEGLMRKANIEPPPFKRSLPDAEKYSGTD